MEQEILKVVNAQKRFGAGGAMVRALDGVTFTMERGDFIAIMGASGSGKSTLLNVISTIEPLSGGEVFIDGKPITVLKDKELAAFRRDNLGFIFQEYNLLDSLTIEENIALPLNLQKQSLITTTKKVYDVGETFGVVDQFSKFPYELSGGQRQRVACARAVITSPALVLADEPTGALDSKNSKNLMEQFCLMNQTLSSSILMVTHDATVASYSKRVIFLQDGKIYSEVVRGDRERGEFYQEILKVTSTLGGEEDAV